MIQTVTIYKIDILRVKIEDWESVKQKLLDLRDTVDLKQGDSYSTSYVGGDLSEEIRVGEAAEEILKPEYEEILEYINENWALQADGMNGWFQTYEASEQHTAHIHAYSAASSLIYLNYDQESHRSTQYLLDSHFEPAIFNWSDPHAEEGYWYVWPPFLAHQSQPHSNPDAPTREIVSFNFNLLTND